MLSHLQQHQSEFAAALIRRQGDDSEFICKLRDSSKIAPQLALDIYRNNTRGARMDALASVYPVCQKILGDDVFRSIAREYVLSCNDRQPDLNLYGKLFNRHFQSLLDAGRLSEDYAYLADLAELEFKMHAAYYADNDAGFDFQLFKLKVNNEEPFCLKISASLWLLRSEYPIYDIWLNDQKRQSAKKVYAIEETQYLLIYRDRYKPDVRPVSKDEYLLLEACINKIPFQDLVENPEYDIDTILPKLIADRWIIGIE